MMGILLCFFWRCIMCLMTNLYVSEVISFCFSYIIYDFNLFEDGVLTIATLTPVPEDKNLVLMYCKKIDFSFFQQRLVCIIHRPTESLFCGMTWAKIPRNLPYFILIDFWMLIMIRILIFSMNRTPISRLVKMLEKNPY